jgi:hypothetical protein
MKALHWSTRLELVLAEPSALRVLDTKRARALRVSMLSVRKLPKATTAEALEGLLPWNVKPLLKARRVAA